MNILGLDYGERYIGCAVSTVKSNTPFALKIIDTKVTGDPVQPCCEFYPARVEPVSRHPKSNECLLNDIFSLGNTASHAPDIFEYALRMLVEDLPESRLTSGK